MNIAHKNNNKKKCLFCFVLNDDFSNNFNSEFKLILSYKKEWDDINECLVIFTHEIFLHIVCLFGFMKKIVDFGKIKNECFASSL